MTDATPNAAQPKSRRRWYQFGLGTLLLAVAALSVWLAVVSREARQQKQAVDRIRQLGGLVSYDYEFGEDGNPTMASEPGPDWLRRIVGVDYFTNVVHVSCYSKVFNNTDLMQVAHLPRLRSLSLSETGITAYGLESIESAKSLRHLTLVGASIDDAGLRHLGKLTQLQSLTLIWTSVTDDGLNYLNNLTELEYLGIGRAHVTDRGLANLKSLKRLKGLRLQSTEVDDGVLAQFKGMSLLESLILSDTKIDDAGLESLTTLTHLKDLRLESTKVTDTGVAKLQKALPNCKIVH